MQRGKLGNCWTVGARYNLFGTVTRYAIIRNESAEGRGFIATQDLKLMVFDPDRGVIIQ